MKKKSTILVTGGAGFIGSSLIDRLLELGNRIICFDNFDNFYPESVKFQNLDSALKSKDFKLIRGDLRFINEIEHCFHSEKIKLVVHLAAKAGVRPSIKDPLSYYDVNVKGTINLLEVMKKYSVNKLIFASSSSVYGNNKEVPFNESANADRPISPYAASKRAGELICYNYHFLYGFEIFCLRLFTVYGPRQRPDLAIHKFSNRILNNQPIDIYGDNSSARDYTFIDDIVQGFCLAIDQIKGYGIINLGESQAISINKMISTLEYWLNKKAILNHLPQQAGDVFVTLANISKAKKMLNYQPAWNFEKGIEKFIQWKIR